MPRLGCHHRAYRFRIHQEAWLDGWTQLRVPMGGPHLPKQLNCQIWDMWHAGLGGNMVRISQNLRRDWIEQKLVFFQGILCKHISWRLLKPWCNIKHENMQNGKMSNFLWFRPFSVRNAVSTCATLQGTLGVSLQDKWLQVVNEDFSWNFDTAQTFRRLLWC